jgi:hypothetical protein
MILARLIRTYMELQNQLLNQSSLFHETFENEFSVDDMLKDFKVYIPMEYHQRVIIKFLFNERCEPDCEET